MPRWIFAYSTIQLAIYLLLVITSVIIVWMPVFYDLLASEARLASYILVAQSDFGQEHWFALGRLLTSAGSVPALLSWSGSMFEYLMPLLVMPKYEHTLLDRTYQAIVLRQIEYGRQRGVPGESLNQVTMQLISTKLISIVLFVCRGWV